MVAGCGAPRRPADPPCSAAADARARYRDAEPVAPLDLDGDGDGDPVFRAHCVEEENCRFLFYLAPAGGCARLLGDLRALRFDEPSCDAPGTPERPCRLDLRVGMDHGDAEEYFYDFVDGAYVYAGAGRYFPPAEEL